MIDYILAWAKFLLIGDRIHQVTDRLGGLPVIAEKNTRKIIQDFCIAPPGNPISYYDL